MLTFVQRYVIFSTWNEMIQWFNGKFNQDIKGKLTSSIESVGKLCANFAFYQSTCDLCGLSLVLVPNIFRVRNVAVVWMKEYQAEIRKYNLSFHDHVLKYHEWMYNLITQLVTTRGCVQGTLLSSLTISLQVAFLNRLSSLYFGPSHVKRKQ